MGVYRYEGSTIIAEKFWITLLQCHYFIPHESLKKLFFCLNDTLVLHVAALSVRYGISCMSGAPCLKKFRRMIWEQFTVHKNCASFGLSNLIYTQINSVEKFSTIKFFEQYTTDIVSLSASDIFRNTLTDVDLLKWSTCILIHV